MTIRIPLIQINGVLRKLPAGDKFANSVIDSFTFTQVSPDTVWLIIHNMNKFPSVTITLNDGTEAITQVTYVDSNTITLEFSKPMAGKAFLN